MYHGARVRARFAAASVVLIAAAMSAAMMTAASPARADNTTISYGPLRTGWDPNEANLSPSSVSASDFGQLFSTALDGQVYAQPLVAGGMVLAVTENDTAYGLDPQTGAIRWQNHVGSPWPASAIGCGDLVPDIGITSTPVYDPATGTAYFAAKVNDGPDVDHPHWYLHAISVQTGVERSGFPTTIGGSPTNNPANTFDPMTAGQRAGLLLLGGVVYVAFASHCDDGPYVGYVAGVSASTGRQTTLWATEGSSSSAEAGIWQSGGGLVSDGPGRIILATGNGVSPAPGPGSSPPSSLAESVVRLGVNGDGSLTAQDFFSPVNNTRLDLDDQDLGSGGPLAIPDGYGTASHPHLLVQVGKDGRVFLLDRDNLGGTGQGAGGTDAALQVAGPYNGVWGHPAFWGDGTHGYVYDIENSGVLREFQVGATAGGVPQLTSIGTSANSWGYTSGSPVVTSDGATAGSALVWAVYSTGSTGAGASLRAYDANPTNGVLQQLYSLPIGTASKFAVPATDAGRLYVGTRDGNLIGVGRPSSSALSGPSTDFGSVAVNGSQPRTVTVTATRSVTVSSVTTSAPFQATPPSLPVTLTTGQTLAVPVTFTPTTPGPSAGSLTFGTDAGALAFDLHGSGTAAGLSAMPTSLAFGQVPTGGSVTQSVDLTNTGTANETIQSARGPAAPYDATAGLPATGTVLAPGASVTVPVTFSPTSTGPFADSLTVTADAGQVTVPLSGTGVSGAPHLTLTPTSLDFGSVLLGQSSTRSFDITNTGNLVLTLNKAAPPAGAFSTTTPVSEGQQLSPGDVIHQSITFFPTASGVSTGSYTITGNDGQGARTVAFTGVGVNPNSSGGDDGYWVAAAGGGVSTFGGAGQFGSLAGVRLNAPVVGMSPSVDQGGYWLVGGDGGIFTFGDAGFYGSTGNIRLARPVLGLAPTGSGRGYWLYASDGGVFSFGDATFFGSTGNVRLAQPVVGMASTPDGRGYWLVAADGGVFSFGDAGFYGSTGNVRLAQPIVAMVPTSDGRGYTLVGRDGGIFTFGDAAFVGSLPGLGVRDTIVSVASTADGGGYLELASSGHIYSFGDAPYFGDAGPGAVSLTAHRA